MINKTDLNMWYTAFARPKQKLNTHAENVSAFASQFGKKCDIVEFLSIAGFWHDLGKASPAFQNYLFNHIGKEQHSIFGAKRVYTDVTSYPRAAEIISNVIASHHGALHDNLAPDGSMPLHNRLEQAALFSKPSNSPSIDINALENEFAQIINAAPNKSDIPFFISMFIKWVYSCLVDADRLDAFLSEGGVINPDKKPDWDNLLVCLQEHLSQFDSISLMAKLRQNVSDACAKAGLRDLGIYKLEVPTGGGKTLSSLRFALEHARYHKLDRVIYVIPYLSILSQTADEIRKALHADDEIVLEHHSNFLPDESVYYKLHTDRWDMPIILTTQVQFLESVFSARGSDLRKLHAMSRSVFIFDEVQSLPIKCVHLFNGAINFLHYVCGSTVLLCTATQPLLDKVERPVYFSDIPSIVACAPAPDRTSIINATVPGGYTYLDLSNFVLKKHNRATLVIVNTKAAAKKLYIELKQAGEPVTHLSTNMCSAHRDTVIAELRKRLNPETASPVICVSTQLIEAGVDISFECVIRDIAGLDSINQAAGRCNRHGEYGEIKPVYVINIAGENLDKLPDVKEGARITKRLFDENKDENKIDINEYYSHYFYARRNMMDYPIPSGGSVYDLLSVNTQGQNAFKSRKDKQGIQPPALRPAIRSAADAFYVIERGKIDVVVPYGESMDIVTQYLAAEDITKRRNLLRVLGKYTVSVYKYQLDELNRCRALTDKEGLTCLEPGFYDQERGIDSEGSHEFLFM